MPLTTECRVCGSTIEYSSEFADGQNAAADEQKALDKWLEAHRVCRESKASAEKGK